MAEKLTPTQPTADPEDSVDSVPWADRVAMQVWIILFLLTLCIALLKFLIGF